eukprot:TRINITY_DN652_c0_g2_i1.p1 TRINITY_DN652_c0_g2~~TRINITY_DN652_c0_g2_i1.p1  ORF type:complete len:164 (-),score=28.12 TRINITY_DN652_c0_g2_i1:241-732(-)
MGAGVKESKVGDEKSDPPKMKVADYLKKKQIRNNGITRDEWIEMFALYQGNSKKLKITEPPGGWNVENLATRYKVDQTALGHVFKYLNVPTVVWKNGRNEGHWKVTEETNKPDLKKYAFIFVLLLFDPLLFFPPNLFFLLLAMNPPVLLFTFCGPIKANVRTI